MADEDEVIEAEQGGDERPEWLPSEFKTPEDLAKSYAESRRLIEETGRERNELRETVDELVQQMETFTTPPPQQTPLSQDPLYGEYERAYEAGDVQGMFTAQAKLALAAAEVAQQNSQGRLPGPDVSALTKLAENEMRSQYPDFDEYRDATIQVLRDNPHLVADAGTFDGVQKGIDTAFQIAQGRASREAKMSAAEKAAQDESARQAKLQAQGVPGNGTRPQRVTEASDVWTRIKNADVGGFKLPS